MTGRVRYIRAVPLVDALQDLLATVREECPRGLWARGVKLAAQGAVSQQARSADEIVLRVDAPGLLVAPAVVLYPRDLEWDCDCNNPIDACEHVAAAVIAAAGAEQRGEPLRSLAVTGQLVGYRFSRSGGELVLERVAGDRPIAGSVRDVPGLHLAQTDLDVDEVVRAAGGKVLRRAQLSRILDLLDGASDVTFEGKPVYASGDPVLPLGVVRDEGDGVRLEIVPSLSITEVVGAGVALCGDTLQPLGHPEITGERLEKLPFGRRYARSEFAALVTEVLPGLEADIPVEIATTALPELTDAARPRIELDIQQSDQLSVLPTLVYGTPPIARIDGGKLVHLRGPAPIRDRVREKELVTELRDELNLVPGRRVDFSGQDAVRFTQKLRLWRGESPDRGGRDFVLDRPLEPRIDVTAGFDIVFESAPGDDGAPVRRASGAAVIGAWQSGLELVPLDGGGWAPLPADWLSRYGDRVADLLAAREASGRVPRYALPNLAALCDELSLERPTFVDAVGELLEDFAGIPTAELPADFSGTLRDYQRRGVDWLCVLRDAGLGAVLADDMGLGKTVQALCSARGRTLVVCPTSVLPVWADELRRFRPLQKACIYHGADRALDPDADFTLTSYALLRIDSKALAAVDWDTVILDEAQAIKNPTSQAARAAGRLRGKFRLAMSGTPVENRLDELWSLFDFANRGLLGDRSHFGHRYSRPIARGEPGAAERLRDRIRPFLLRRLKQDVAAELPPRTEAVIYCELDESERSVYDAIRVATLESVVSSLRQGGSVLAALEALLRLRQAACHSALVPGQRADSSAKLRELMPALDTVIADGHKALVFSQWTSLLDLVEPHLRAAGLAFERLDGSTRDRGAVVQRFQSSGGPPIMLVSLKAGGTGLNLTAADHVFLLDPWWNPAVEDQAADRTHRIGQTRPVLVYRLVATDTIESRILTLQASKRSLADAALGEGERAAGLTRDDLLALLAD